MILSALKKPVAHNAAHNALVREALQELALAGYTAWPTNTGAYKTESGGFIKYGKKGGGDITGILPVRARHFMTSMPIIIGQHFEAEAKTGSGKQSENQENHQQFCIERKSGLYILFRSVPELLEKIRIAENE